ncbi:hypothetical protein DL765_009954 [Monosporascus sp. GIB2]|nr:hypothetical protein DL765_009954 [Monosporascus sp. GIB2]
MRSALFLSAGLSASASIIPRQDARTCTAPEKRLEWRQMTVENKKQYIESVQCLKTKPSKLGDDVSGSAIWDPETGFGGNGVPHETEKDKWKQPRNCVPDGPFKDLRLEYLGLDMENHCLARNFNNGTSFPGDMFSPSYTKEAVENVMALTTYPDFRYDLEGTPHGAIHSAVGGDLSPPTSPNDPIFFLHHVQIDRLWYLWQQANPEVRNTDFGGPITRASTAPDTTLEDLMPFFNLTADIKVSEIE